MAGGAARDMPAGPSEVLVIADAAADPVAVCWDLLSQAEHGPDSQAIVISDEQNILNEVARLLPVMAAGLPRAAILAKSLRYLRRILVGSISEAVEISNRYAPEHLILQITNARAALEDVRNAGSVFVGAWTPESVGDYCSGTNHVLPTYGYADTYSGLGVDQFMRFMTVQELSRDGLSNISSAVITLAGLEGLDAHAAAVSRRLEPSA